MTKLILPKLNTTDPKGRWFVYYSVWNERSEKLQRVKEYVPSESDVTIRHLIAERILKDLTKKLSEGWRPFLGQKKTGVQYSVYHPEIQNLPYKNEKQFRAYSNAPNPDYFLYWAEKFIDNSLQKNKTNKTIQTYESKLRRFCKWLNWSHTTPDITAITKTELIDYFIYLAREERLSIRSLHAYRQVLAAVFDLAYKARKIEYNPVRELDELPAGVDKDYAPRPIVNADIAKFRDRIRVCDPQLWMFIEFESYCMLRPGTELRLLKVGDINMYRGLIEVSREHAKNRKARHSTIPEHFCDKLRNVYKIDNYPSHYYIFGHHGQPGEQPLGRNNMNNRFVAIRKALGLSNRYKLYSWKHTGNCLALDADVPIYEIRDQNGHSSVTITEIYTRNKLGSVSHTIRTQMPNLDSL